jgi:hypothetical protein
MSKTIVLTIDRATWLRGEKNSYLRRPSDKKMCCLGFLGKQLGVTYTRMTNRSSPGSLKSADQKKFMEVGLLTRLSDMAPFETETCSLLMSVNDQVRNITEEYRESRLKTLFKTIGIKVKFIGRSK